MTENEKMLYKNLEHNMQAEIEKRLLAREEFLQSKHMSVWLTISGWLATINGGGVVALLSYWATAHGKEGINCYALYALILFIAGLLSAILCIALGFIVSYFSLNQYKYYINEIIRSEKSVTTNVEQKCFVLWMDNLVLPLIVLSLAFFCGAVLWGLMVINLL